MHFFIYNPYSIVKETQVAKTNAERNRLDCVHRLSRGYSFRALRSQCNHTAVLAISAHPYGREVTNESPKCRRSEMVVELIGIEPTTLCLQSRCSPS